MVPAGETGSADWIEVMTGVPETDPAPGPDADVMTWTQRMLLDTGERALIITATGNGMGFAHVVAMNACQRFDLLDRVLRDTGHHEILLFACGHPVCSLDYDDWPDRHMVVSYHGEYGVARYVGPDLVPDSGYCLAVNPQPVADPPGIYLDSHNQDPACVFPPETVFPMKAIGEILAEFMATGARPASVTWHILGRA